MHADEVRALLRQTGEEITDDHGQVIGYISVQARFRVNRDYLAGGGFLVVERDEETGEFVAVEYDALWDRKGQRHYPHGYSCEVWRCRSLDQAVNLVRRYLNEDG